MIRSPDVSAARSTMAAPQAVATENPCTRAAVRTPANPAVAVVAIVYVLVNVAVDMLYRVLDPRIRGARIG